MTRREKLRPEREARRSQLLAASPLLEGRREALIGAGQPPRIKARRGIPSPEEGAGYSSRSKHIRI